MNSEFAGKTVAVIGLARSGLAAAEVLTKLGARVRLYDSKPADQLAGALASARALGIEPQVGGGPLRYEGLDSLVTSPGVPKSAPVLQGAVAAGVPVLGEIEAAYRIARAPILAVTGTNGKTTTAVLLGEMLRAAGRETSVAGNIAAGDIALPLIKAAHLAPPEAAIVAEISSFQLEWVSTFRPAVAALLNITPDHGDRQSWEEYRAAKWRIFENQTARDAAVIGFSLASDLPHHKVEAELWEFGGDSNRRGVSESQGRIIAESPRGGCEVICGLNEIKLPGRHNAENVMAAAAMALAFGIGMEPIRQAATAFTGVVHRLEYVGTINGVNYVNNSMCTNAAAFQRSLEALPGPKVVIAGGVFKGGELTSLAEAVARNAVKALVLIGRSAPDIEAAARAAGCEAVSRAATMPEAVARAAALASPGETVLLAPACASFDMFRDFEERGDRFKESVRALA